MKLTSVVLVLAAAGGCIIPPAGGAGSSTGPSGGTPPSGNYEAQPAVAGGAPQPAAAPAPPPVVSITMHSDCPTKVKLFMGEKPKFGSGTYTSLDSNNTTSYSMKPGDMIWIVDESENGISSFSAGNSNQSMKILQSCSGFGPY